MKPSTTSRVSPQAEAFSASSKPSQQLPLLDDDDGVVRVISNGRLQSSYPAAKAWVSEAVPPIGSSDDDLSVPATATWVYRQRRDFDDDGGTSALVAWLAALLCVPRLGSGRLRSPVSRENSVDSVDFVSTWQKAQADAAARRVVPVLKRASETTPPIVPNTPELLPSDTAPPRRSSATMHGFMTVVGPGSQAGGVYSTSYVPSAQRPWSSQLPPFRASTGNLVQYVSDDLAERPSSSRGSSRPDSRQTAASCGHISKRSVHFG